MTTIEYIIPYKELIRKNGLGTCLEIVPGTREYLTHDKHYGKENTNEKEKM